MEQLDLVEHAAECRADAAVLEAEKREQDDMLGLGKPAQQQCPRLVTGGGGQEARRRGAEARALRRRRPRDGKVGKVLGALGRRRRGVVEQSGDGDALPEEPRGRATDLQMVLPHPGLGPDGLLAKAVEGHAERTREADATRDPELAHQHLHQAAHGRRQERVQTPHGEAALDALLQHAHDVHLLAHANDGELHADLLRYVEEVVQQRLPRPRAEVLESVEDDDDGARLLETVV
mmetsp:Transcript_80419/g.232289  ORF Transcript_80419/g.232289 Transcript_80419/m.232289 type:complete len:234 (-) Transcript_80419:414-1115(-)